MSIRERDLRHVDLNLLVTFLVLLRERSVSQAARRLYLGQPAVSGALARLRELFEDALFIRTPKGMEPTAKALELERRLAPALERIQETMFEPPTFEPADTDRTFVLGMPDWVELWLGPALFASVREAAPRARLAIKPTDPFESTAMLERNEMDASILQTQETPPPAWLRRRPLRTLGMRCIYPRELKRGSKGLTLAEYTRHAHLMVSYRGVFESTIDTWLTSQGLRRTVAYSTTRFGTLPALLRSTRAIATVPEMLAEQWREEQGLQVSAVPVPLPEFSVSALWLATKDSDPGLQWLLGLAAQAVARTSASAAKGHR
ncbi:LysR family transcriptional regulator [Myxococcus sp. K38C18041901]|uniref:LysR family transcriptional regulator n=1 Tax=Myxococcus guangdongensis TaxID=2906760 RepID=UPI0020A79763|nr:LysR family transcriptional regulator [Myxococcus guangdongensis]MCP3062653.1 LysR family transcriptional regulator [Myxococcus guangdongensis]